MTYLKAEMKSAVRQKLGKLLVEKESYISFSQDDDFDSEYNELLRDNTEWVF